MSLPRIFLTVTIALVASIGVAVYVKSQNKQAKGHGKKHTKEQTTLNQGVVQDDVPIEIDLALLDPTAGKAQSTSTVKQALSSLPATSQKETTFSTKNTRNEDGSTNATSGHEKEIFTLKPDPRVDVEDGIDRIEYLFKKNSPLPIVETIRYKSRVSWRPGKPAWLSDYASHYKTHVHFIARSLNESATYTPKTIFEGDEFNILRVDRDFYFYLLIDLSKCKLRLYYVLPKTNQLTLLKTYHVGLGRLDSTKQSGCLTPLGKFSLGSRVALFQPKMMGPYKGKRVELIRIFGTRWIPFEKEMSGCSEPAKGFGIHGTPWIEQGNTLVSSDESIGRYESDGCIRLRCQDIEELFAIISTRPSVVEITKDFRQTVLPGKEVQL